ncbi:MAG: hypothetical protein JXR58_06440 [Bacteroidales bacterium]|nr:hypothetical protein [Bacteroidales bacterium]
MNNEQQNISAKIIESPRDGWQAVKTFIPTKTKAEYINKLLEIGFHTIEIGSFVSPKAIPQLADTEALISMLDFSKSKSEIMVLTGNKKGIDKAALFEEINSISFPFSISPEFLKRNLNISSLEAEELVKYLIEVCNKNKKTPAVYIAMAFGNPYGDSWSLDLLSEIVGKLVSFGLSSLSLTDILGTADSKRISEVYGRLSNDFPQIEFGLHLHTKKSDFEEKIKAAWEKGCKKFDSVLGGAGGCPMTGKELTGNLNSKDLIEFLKKQNSLPNNFLIESLNSITNPALAVK